MVIIVFIMSQFVQYKVNGQYPDCIRQQLVAKIIQYIDQRGFRGDDDLGYKLSRDEYNMLCVDIYTGQRICSNRTGRRWLNDALAGKFKKVPKYKRGANRRLSHELKAILYENQLDGID